MQYSQLNLASNFTQAANCTAANHTLGADFTCGGTFEVWCDTCRQAGRPDSLLVVEASA